jgi:hypothetical protein
MQTSRKTGLNYRANEHITHPHSSPNQNYRKKTPPRGKYVKSNGAGEGIMTPIY